MISDETICQGCGFANSNEFLFCRKCGLRIFEDFDEPEKILLIPADLGAASAGKRSISLFRIAAALGLIFFVFIFLTEIISISGRGRSRTNAREKACYANMRVILGAIEMYNMDHTIMINELRHEDVTSDNGELIKGRYLKHQITPPESNCRYSGKNLTGSGLIVCDEHGTVEAPDDN